MNLQSELAGKGQMHNLGQGKEKKEKENPGLNILKAGNKGKHHSVCFTNIRFLQELTTVSHATLLDQLRDHK